MGESKESYLCDTINTYLTDANINGPDTYGNARVISKRCYGYTKPEKFNAYCQIPTLSNAFTGKCDALSSEVKDDGMMIYNNIMRNSIDDWITTLIPSPPMSCATSARENQLMCLAAGNYMMNYTVPTNTEDPFNVRISTIGAPNANVRISTFGAPSNVPYAIYAMDGLGNLYYCIEQHLDIGKNGISIHKYDPSNNTTAILFSVTWSRMDAIVPSPDGKTIYVIGSFISLWKEGFDDIKLLTALSPGMIVVAGGNVGRYMSKVNNNGVLGVVVKTPFVVNGDNRNYFDYYRYKDDVWDKVSEGGVDVALPTLSVSNWEDIFVSSTHHMNDDGIVLLGRLDTKKHIVKIVRVDLMNLAAKIVSNELPSNLVGFLPSPSFATMWLFAEGGDVFTTTDVGLNVQLHTNPGASVMVAAAVNEHSIYYAFGPSGNQTVSLYDNRQEYHLFRTIMAAHPGYKLYFMDNADIVVFDESTNLPLFHTNTNDGQNFNTLMARGEFVKFSPTDITIISHNGLYKLDLPTDDTMILSFNSVNSPGFVNSCTSLASRGDRCTGATKEYCNSMTDPKGFFNDPRCFCFENNEGIVASMFNTELLKQSPALYNQLLGIAPCMSKVCQPFTNNNTWIGHKIMEYDCATTINICTNVLTLGQEAEINGDIVVETNCGSSSSKTPCSSTCPIGQTCDTDTQFCTNHCINDSQCNSGDACDLNNQYCRATSKINSDDMSTKVVIGIVVGVVVLLVVIILIYLGATGKLRRR